QLATRNAGSACRATLYWKIATGNDSLTLLTTEAQEATYIALCVEGGSGDEPTVVTDYDSDADDDAEFDPITGLSAGDWLSLLFVGVDASGGTNLSVTAPSGWGNLLSQLPSTTSSAATFSMERELSNVTSISPAAATLSRNEQWVTFNV